MPLWKMVLMGAVLLGCHGDRPDESIEQETQGAEYPYQSPPEGTLGPTVAGPGAAAVPLHASPPGSAAVGGASGSAADGGGGAGAAGIGGTGGLGGMGGVGGAGGASGIGGAGGAGIGGAGIGGAGIGGGGIGGPAGTAAPLK
jgi:hypothetical protein